MSDPIGGFVGRRDAWRALERAYARACGGDVAVLFVDGEAGIGKTRLVSEFVSCAGDAWVLRGVCMELGEDGPSYAPFAAALRSLVRGIGADGLTAIVPAAGMSELARLLPELGDQPSAREHGTLFETVLALVGRLAEERPVVLLVEDAHWADRSTRNLLTFLVHSLAAAKVLVIVTHRDLAHGHPFRSVLVDLERVDGVARLTLPRLTRAEVAAQTTAIRGHAIDAPTLDMLFSRSAGNPLFVEALLACDGAVADVVGGPLYDLLVAPVERLPDSSQRVLHIAAAGGCEVRHTLLAAVAGVPGAALTEALRPAVHARVLIGTEDGYRFRHALIRDAVYETLMLPGERIRWHRRYAEALEADPSLVPHDRAPMELAHHWYAARNVASAFRASWAAAHEARIGLAPAERLRMLERVLQLWSQVADPAELLGADRGEVLRYAIEAADDSGELEHGLRLVDQAIEAAKSGQDRLRAALALHWQARLRSKLGLPWVEDDLPGALRTLSTEPDNADRARLLGYLAQRLCAEGDHRQARSLAEEATALADRVADPQAKAQALTTLASLAAQEGRLEAARAGFARARRVGEQIDVRALVRVDIAESHELEALGEHELAAEVARAGQVRAREAGLHRARGAQLSGNLAESLVSLGRWDEAIGIIDHAAELGPPPLYLVNHHCLRGEVMLARGDLVVPEAALLAVHSIMHGRYESAQQRFPLATLETELRLAQARPGQAVAVAESALDAYDPARESRYAWALLSCGARAWAHLAQRTRIRGDDVARATVAATRERLQTRAGRLPCRTPVEQAQRATFVAELAEDFARVGAARTAVQAWERTAQPYRLAVALLRYAEEAVGRNNRPGAAEPLRRCIELADDLGAGPLRAQAHALVVGSRLTLAAPGTAEGAVDPLDELGLTAREQEVLRLVALGQTNRQIAGSLFISTKTASVHVSRILSKLDATNRGQAAAIAHRLRLVRYQDA